MAIYVIGLNYMSAPLALREQLAYIDSERIDALLHLKQVLGVEVALLSTCNRTELYLAHEKLTESQAILKQALNQWAYTKQIPLALLVKHSYILTDKKAIRHIYRVASGLDSMVLGETQILGQMKAALRYAHAAHTLGNQLQYIFQHSFSTAKAVRTHTAIGTSNISLAAAAVKLAQKIFGDISKINVLMIGAGEMIELCMSHFLGQQPQHLMIANRSIDKAIQLITLSKQRNQYNHKTALNAINLNEISEILGQYHLIISCTGSKLPIIHTDMVRKALMYKHNQRLSKTTMMVDLAVPRDIASEIGKLADIYLYTIDDLGRIVQEGRDIRNAAVIDAEKIITRKVNDYLNWQAMRRATPIIQSIKNRAWITQSTELQSSIVALNNGYAVEQILEQLSKQLTKKLLHNTFNLIQTIAVDHRINQNLLEDLNNEYSDNYQSKINKK